MDIVKLVFILRKNIFPVHLIDKCVYRYLNTAIDRNGSTQNTTSQGKQYFYKLRYLGRFSTIAQSIDKAFGKGHFQIKAEEVKANGSNRPIPSTWLFRWRPTGMWGRHFPSLEATRWKSSMCPCDFQAR